MDFILKEAQALWQKVGQAAGNLPSETDYQKAEKAKIELRAELDPKVWNQIEGFVNQMLDIAVKTGNVKQTIADLKEYAGAQQRQFEDQEAQKEAEKRLVQDELSMSPEVKALTQPLPAAE